MELPLSRNQLYKLHALSSWLTAKGFAGINDALEQLYGGTMLPSRRHAGRECDKVDLFAKLTSQERKLSDSDQLHVHDTLCGKEFNFLRGSRSAEDYAFDLITSWLVEDVLRHFVNDECESNLLLPNGDDVDRDFIKKPTAGADYRYGRDNSQLELFTDFGGHWRRSGYIDFKPGKWNRLSLKGYGVLCLDIDSDQGLLVQSVGQVAEWCGGIPQKKYRPQMSKEVYPIDRPNDGWEGPGNVYGLRILCS